MTIQALVVSVETGINTVNAEKGPETLPLNITSLDPLSISIKDQGSRLNNKLSSHINDIDLYVRDGNWNDIFQQNLSSTNINISNTNDMAINSHINDIDLYIRDGNWNDSSTSITTSKNIIIQDSSDTVIEKTLSNTTMGATDSASLSLLEGNGDSVTWSLDYGGVTDLSSSGPSDPPATITSSFQSSSITYNSTGDITITADNFDKTNIFVSKDINTFRNLSYSTTESIIKISHNNNIIEDTSYSPLRIFTTKNFDIFSNASYLPNNTVVNINLDADELKDVNLKNIQIATADDIAARSPSFCNAVQESFYITNQVPIGYFEIDGVAEFSDINKNNDPRLVGGSTQTGGDTGGTGGTGGTDSGPIQSWSS